MANSVLYTTLGPRQADELGMILPHEHIFVDLRQDHPEDYAQAEPEAVAALMGPQLARAQAAGVTALVECTPVGVGRRVDLVKAASVAANFPVVVPTGIYREPWLPQWVHEASEDKLYAWMLGELSDQVEASGVRAAWIKLSAGDNGITDAERKVLRAAARAGQETGAVIGSHTIRGSVVRDQLDTLATAGYTPERFIWIHAQAEPDFALNVEMAQRGAYIEYDWIGGASELNDSFYIDRIQRMADAGLIDHVLISHDRGWYDPALPGGGVPKAFTYIPQTFLPMLESAGFDAAAITQITVANPFRAFAR